MIWHQLEKLKWKPSAAFIEKGIADDIAKAALEMVHWTNGYLWRGRR